MQNIAPNEMLNGWQISSRNKIFVNFSGRKILYNVKLFGIYFYEFAYLWQFYVASINLCEGPIMQIYCE